MNDVKKLMAFFQIPDDAKKFYNDLFNKFNMDACLRTLQNAMKMMISEYYFFYHIVQD